MAIFLGVDGSVIATPPMSVPGLVPRGGGWMKFVRTVEVPEGAATVVLAANPEEAGRRGVASHHASASGMMVGSAYVGTHHWRDCRPRLHSRSVRSYRSRDKQLRSLSTIELIRDHHTAPGTESAWGGT